MEIHPLTHSTLWWHLGGCSKSAKYHLKRVIGTVKLNFEELATVLSQIEACLNSRPLTPLTTEDDGVETLTPGHFFDWQATGVPHLQKFSKWHQRQRNFVEGDVVVLREDGMVPCKWPIARIMKVHPGKDGVACGHRPNSHRDLRSPSC